MSGLSQSHRCQCLTNKGTQCSRSAKEDSRFCYQHQSCSNLARFMKGVSPVNQKVSPVKPEQKVSPVRHEQKVSPVSKPVSPNKVIISKPRVTRLPIIKPRSSRISTSSLSSNSSLNPLNPSKGDELGKEEDLTGLIKMGEEYENELRRLSDSARNNATRRELESKISKLQDKIAHSHEEEVPVRPAEVGAGIGWGRASSKKASTSIKKKSTPLEKLRQHLKDTGHSLNDLDAEVQVAQQQNQPTIDSKEIWASKRREKRLEQQDYDTDLQEAIRQSLRPNAQISTMSTLEQAQALIAEHAKLRREETRQEFLQDVINQEAIDSYNYILPLLPFWANYPMAAPEIASSVSIKLPIGTSFNYMEAFGNSEKDGDTSFKLSPTGSPELRIKNSEKYKQFLRSKIITRLYGRLYHGEELSDELKEEIADAVISWLEEQNAPGIELFTKK